MCLDQKQEEERFSPIWRPSFLFRVYESKGVCGSLKKEHGPLFLEVCWERDACVVIRGLRNSLEEATRASRRSKDAMLCNMTCWPEGPLVPGDPEVASVDTGMKDAKTD